MIDKLQHWDYNSPMNINAEIITTGTELLLGELVDTNSSYLARRLSTIGVNLFYITSVGDNEDRMADTLVHALKRSDVIITTGGLGPTVDDVTRAAVSRATHRGLVLHEDLLRQIEARFARWGRQMTSNNRRQAYLPEGAIPIENPVGTAPCFIVEEPGQGVIISLPGVPREMEFLMEQRVLPYLREHFGLTEVIKVKVLKTCAIGESTVDDRIKDLMTSRNPTIGLAAHPAQTDVRITAKGESEDEVDRLIADMEAEVRVRLGDVIYGTGKQRLEDVAAELMKSTSTSVALAETVTHGIIGRRLVAAFQGDGLDYIKRQHVLDVSLDTLRSELSGLLACSDEALLELEADGEALSVRVAQTIREQSGADIGLAIIGLEQVNEHSYDPFYGKIWCALATSGPVIVQSFNFGGESDVVVPWVSGMSLDMLRRTLMGWDSHPDY